MSPPYDRERLRTLIHRFLDKTLSEDELREMEATLRDQDDARRELLLASALHQELFVLHELPAREAADRVALDVPETGDPAGRRPATLRSSRRFPSQFREGSWAPAIAAAAILLGLVLFFLMTGSERRNPGQARREAPRGHDATAPIAAPENVPAPGGHPESGADPVPEERIREEASRRLADLERRRAALEQPAPKDADPAVLNQQKTDLGLLQEEKRKIEEDMRSAIEQARRAHPEPPRPTTTAEATPPAKDPPMPGKSAVLASVERVEGEGTLIRKEGRFPVREGSEILPGDGLETASGTARLVLRFADRTRMELRGDTSISDLTDEGAPGGPPGKQIQLVRGTLVADVAKQPAGRPLILRTPHSEAMVLGTSLRLLVDPGEKGASRLEVLEGKVRFTRQVEKKASVDVTAGRYAVAALGIPLLSRPIPQTRTGTPEKPVLAGLSIVSADSGRPLLQFDPLEDGTVITLADLSTRALNIQASTSPATVGSVLFLWDGIPVMEGRAPYLLAGNDTRGKPLAWTPTPGEHTLTVTPYSGPSAANKREGTGTVGTGLTVRLLVR
ncbi:MAG TPA: FecR domain-containing protein [Planctomycetota bacterium]|nr:FecR domain-containing protein [Planctomycetota bacterium]